jgi:F0F1-type ATP synthase assembly protein I
MKDNKSSKHSQFKGAAESFRKAAPYFNIAYVLMASIVMLAALGWWLDDYFSTRPLLTIVGIIGGLFLGFYNLFQMIKKLEKKK